jgi:uncharacterized damage-inducible protein DinB
MAVRRAFERHCLTPRRARGLALLLPALLLLAPAARAEEAESWAAFRDSYLSDLGRASRKILKLAEEMPEEHYGWRPAEGVRSVGEAFIHVALANYFFPTTWGVAMPEGISQDMEKTVTDKAAIVAALRDSLRHARSVVEQGVELDRKVQLGTYELPAREVLLIMIGHIHEHLGQSIAYARSNGVAPPWDSPIGPSPEEVDL